MERAKVQRIVGVLVIMSLVIIMLPLLINKNDLMTQTASVSPLPVSSENTITPLSTADTVSPTSTEQSASTNISATLPSAPIAPPSIDVTKDSDKSTQNTEDKTVSSGWTVKMGIFREAKNVDRLTKQLQTAGYQIITTTVTLPSGEVGTAVMLKPVDDRVAAQKLAKEIKNQLHLRGIVTSYHVKN